MSEHALGNLGQGRPARRPDQVAMALHFSLVVQDVNVTSLEQLEQIQD